MGSSLISAAEVSGLVFSGVGKNEWFLAGDRWGVEEGGEGVGSQSMVSCFTVERIAGKSVEESSSQKGDNDICTLLSSPLDMLSTSNPSIPGLVRTLPGNECIEVKPGSESEEIMIGVSFKVDPGMGDADSEEVSGSSTGRDLEPMPPAASILFRRVVASLAGGGTKASILESPSVEDISMGILDVPGRVRGRGPWRLNWLFWDEDADELLWAFAFHSICVAAGRGLGDIDGDDDTAKKSVNFRFFEVIVALGWNAVADLAELAEKTICV
jgi:hypothetical protein